MALFKNYYDCDPCGELWNDQWSCVCNDKCPNCNAEIEPHHSRQILYDFDVSVSNYFKCLPESKLKLPGIVTFHMVVSAKSEQELRDSLEGLPARWNDNKQYRCPEDIDFTLPDDADAMRRRITNLMKD